MKNPILKLPTAIVAVALLTGCFSTEVAKDKKPNQTTPNYQRAKAFTRDALENTVHNMRITPNWLEEKSAFWFESFDKTKGQQFSVFNIASGQKSALFSQQQLSRALMSLNPGLELDWLQPPLHNLSWREDGFSFSINDNRYECSTNIDKIDCAIATQNEEVKPEYLSPDGKHYVKVENYNLLLCPANNDKCITLTQDGTESTPYAVTHPYPSQLLSNPHFDQQERLEVFWSEDSQYLITFKLHREGLNKLTLTDSVAEDDFTVNTVEFYYPQAGDNILPEAELVLVNVNKQHAQLLDAPKIMQTYYGGPIWGEWQGEHFYYHDRRRGNQEYFYRKINPRQALVTTVVRETDHQFIDPWVQVAEVLPQSNQIIWSSQRSGFQHLYLYDGNEGTLLNSITSGEFTVRVIRGIDEENGVLFFEASGKEPGRDPYLRHLYRVNFDGSNLTLLTPEAMEHDTRLSPDYRFFLDTYSDTSTIPITYIRDAKTGKKLHKVLEADASALFALGWQAPEPFKILADDDKTWLYGLMYKPSDFDATKSYPIINDTYTGPHNFFTPKSFNSFINQRPALAELGFIVIKMDGRGTNKRGKAFHRHAYKNLAAGTDDHVWAIKKLAEDRPYMDLKRVGIFGFSAGGYDTMQAMLRHNDFFKAGVSASGNHDFRVDKAGWNEIWMGWPVTPHWDEQSNYHNVERLKGKLLLAHGELDPNVHISATYRLVDKLIAADKDFELLIMPKMGHWLDGNPYYVEKRWRFFVEHLQP